MDWSWNIFSCLNAWNPNLNAVSLHEMLKTSLTPGGVTSDYSDVSDNEK